MVVRRTGMAAEQPIQPDQYRGPSPRPRTRGIVSPMVRQVWDHQPEEGETDAPYAAFRKYLEMPRPRNMSELARRLGYVPDTLHHWSADFCWTDRANEYDLHLDQVGQAAVEDEVKAMNRENARVARLAVQVAAKALEGYANDLTNEVASRPVTPQAAARLMREGALLLRLTLGEVTERVEGTVDLSKLSDVELKQLDGLVSKAH